MKGLLRYLPSLVMSLMIWVLCAGCSDHARPGILEPVINISGASEISYTEAVVTASIDRRGSSGLSYVRLVYGETGSVSVAKIDGDPESDRWQFRLSGLTPGTAYSCHIEGGTNTAALRSDEISFTTIPNELPRVSAPELLSTGPLGVIASFSILSDGGDAISEAGCEVKVAGASESRRVYIPGSCTGEGEWRLNITGLTPQTSYIITPFASNSIGEAQGISLEFKTEDGIVLHEPGKLEALIGSEVDIDLYALTISGFMNGDDFHTLRLMLGASDEDGRQMSGIRISDIDLTDVSIVEGGGSYDGSRFTETDMLTTGIFADCPRLRSAVLPKSAVCLARDAFARCEALETITLSAGIETLSTSQGCTSLRGIEVSRANDNFKSIDGVLFNHDATRILWFPCGKTGEYELPPSIVSIGENAFAGTSITGLVIPSSVTSISRGAFAGSSLVEISLPDCITNISEGMFQNCSNLREVHLGAGTEYVGDYAFDCTDMTDIYLSAAIPPFATSEAFTNSLKPMTEECTLHVPQGCRKIYSNNAKWGIFQKIEEY